jgi:hypothetical protein
MQRMSVMRFVEGCAVVAVVALAATACGPTVVGTISVTSARVSPATEKTLLETGEECRSDFACRSGFCDHPIGFCHVTGVCHPVIPCNDADKAVVVGGRRDDVVCIRSERKADGSVSHQRVPSVTPGLCIERSGHLPPEILDSE